jgi:hypothetical protein
VISFEIGANRQLPDSDAAVFATTTPKPTTRFRRLRKRRQNSENRTQKLAKIEASESGSLRTAKNTANAGVKNR